MAIFEKRWFAFLVEALRALVAAAAGFVGGGGL